MADKEDTSDAQRDVVTSTGNPEQESSEGHSPYDQEKQLGAAVERDNEIPDDPDADKSEKERAAIDRALLWKLDWNIIPWLSLLYLVSFLDRTNIGNAKLAGLPKDLNLSADGSQYNISLSVFFIFYSLIEPLTNVLLKRFRPSRFLPATMACWGLTMAMMGLTYNFGGLVTARIFLGIFEAGLFPGVSYLISCWYKRSEFGIRQAIFFSGAALAGSFGGLLAYAIEKMNGIGGRGGWAWIFILEGILTFLISVASFFMVHDFPDTASFLSPEDRARVVRRLKVDKQSAAEFESFKMDYFWAAVKDPKTWFQCLIYCGTDMPLYAFSLFLPTIISGLGKYSTVQAQLLTVPPYAVATLMTITVGFIADRTQQRGLCNIVCSLFAIAGFAMLDAGKSAGVSYAGCFLGAMGIYPTIANTIAWGANNVEGVYKRGVVMGMFIGWGNLNGVISSNIYIARDAPHYPIGHSIVLAWLIVGLFGGSVAQHLYLRRENRLRREGKRDHWIEGKTPEEIARLGDMRPDFIYVV